MVCKICENNFTKSDDLIAHLKCAHKITAKNYFEQYFPKQDLFSGGVIPFKSYEQYLQTDFINKRNLKSWLLACNLDNRRKYISSKIKQYLKIKNKKTAPSYVESCLINSIPSVKDLEIMLETDFNSFCDENYIECLFQYLVKDISLMSLKDKTVIIDTREQKPFEFLDFSSKRSKLEYGDYALEGQENIAVERKCYSDFISTFSSDVDRFCRELDRAKSDGGYIVIIAESTLNNILYSKTRRYGKASPHFISHNLRKLLRLYDNLQFVFCSSRKEAAEKSLVVLSMGNHVRNIDLQYYFNYGTNSRKTK